MATRRYLLRSSLAIPRSSCPAPRTHFKPSLVSKIPRLAPPALKSQFRCYSQEERSHKTYTFEEIQQLSTKPNPGRILIDTREPEELKTTGTIPHALNIPVTSQPDAFFITEEEFEDKFGFDRPAEDTEVIFFCKAGVRSRTAAELAKQAGWKNVTEYPGSWLDWDKNGGKRL